MRRLSVLLLLAAVLVVGLPAAAYATDYYVATDGSDTLHSGLQGSPFSSVQKAVDAAAASGGGSVFVGPGTFTGHVTLKNNVSLYGAGASSTTLTFTSGSVITIDGIGGGETVSGFKITGGRAELGGGIYCGNSSPVIADNVITGNTSNSTGSYSGSYYGGGGVYCLGGTPLLRNNVISNNNTSGYDVFGGGVFLSYSNATLQGNTITGNNLTSSSYGYPQGGGVGCRGGSVTFTGNTITSNMINGGDDAQGGGIAAAWATVQIADNEITDNQVMATIWSGYAKGGGIYLSGASGTITRNTVANNTAFGNYAEGGGIMFEAGWDPLTPTISANIVSGNVADAMGGRASGGGINCADGSPRVIGNLIRSNTATCGSSAEGGGLYCDSFWDDYPSRPVISNNVISSNAAYGSYGGGAGAYFSSSQAQVTNNTIVSNQTMGTTLGGIAVDDFWGHGRPTVNNCILWGNTGTEISGVGIGYSCVDGGAAGAGNISAYPLFVSGSDYSLLAGSPASDVASATVAPADDIRGTSRPQGVGFDMGAYEYVAFVHPLPAASADSYAIDEDTVLAVSGRGVLANDTALAEDGPLTAAVSMMPAHGVLGLSANGSFTYTPDAGWSGTDSFEYAARDVHGNVATAVATITVADVPDPPVLAAIGNKSIDERASLVFTASATDVDSPVSSLVFSLGPGAPAGATINPATGSFMWTPTEAQGPGSYPIEVIVSDGAVRDTEVVTVTVAEVPTAPVLAAIGAKSVDELATLAFVASASDEDLPAQTLTFSLGAGAPAGASINAATGAFSWTPTEAQGPGSYDITVQVSDGALTDSETITVTVAEVASAPMLAAIGAKSVDEGAELAFTASASDSDIPADTLTFSLGAGAPAGASINAATGAFSWTPTEAQGPGSYDITIEVSDGSLTDSEALTLTVAEVASAPVLAPIGDKSIDERASLVFTASAVDADLPADTLAFSLGAGAPAGASINAETGSFMWTPTEAQGPGTFDITIVVSDGTLTDSETITVMVAEVASAPVLAPIGDKSVDEGAELAFTAMAADEDLPADTLTFSLGAGAPAGASIDAATGAFAWTPTEVQGPGTFDLTVVVSDGALTDSETITVTVAEVASAPVLAAIGPKSVEELSKLTFTASATDADVPVDTLRFSLGAGAPTGAAIHSVSGAFSWTPTEAQGPGSYDITVVVSDGSLTSSETIRVTVAELPTAPVLAAIGPKSVNELSKLTFTAAASDTDLPANTLTFSLGAGAPKGASINAATGAFSWTPTEAQGPGSYDITVVVSDGTLSDSETFTVTVAEVASPPAPKITTAPPATTEPPAESPAGLGAAPSESTTDAAKPAEEVQPEEADKGAEVVPVSAEAPAKAQAFPWCWLWAVLAVVALGVGAWLLKRRGAGQEKG